MTALVQAYQYDTLVYEPESGTAYVRPKGPQPTHPYPWSGTCATAALALLAAHDRGLEPTAVFYVFEPEDTVEHYGRLPTK